MSSVKLRLGKKDAVLKLWFEMERERQDNLSAAVAETLLYYVRNGAYLKIANIPKDAMKDMPDEYKCLSIAESTPVSKWLQDKEEEGQKISTSIKRILRASITTDDEPLMILSSDELCTINDRKQRSLVSETVIERLSPVEEYKPSGRTESEKQSIEPVQPQINTGPVTQADEIPQEKKETTGISEEESAVHIPERKTEEQGRKKRSGGLIDSLITEGLNI